MPALRIAFSISSHGTGSLEKRRIAEHLLEKGERRARALLPEPAADGRPEEGGVEPGEIVSVAARDSLHEELELELVPWEV